ncbi:MAG: FkbM family methyltransferase [Phycisphaerae bacterium]|nr:FkbM family methyltransferase [Phycisphaerae bacterium]
MRHLNPEAAPITRTEFGHFAQRVQGALAGVQRDLLRLKRRVYAWEAERALAGAGRSPRTRIEFRSQFGEDGVLWELLGGQTSGFYIEVGAFDGRSFAVTYALDAMGWDGLLIEAIPERAEQCRANRPHARVVHAALGARGAAGEIEFQVVEDHFGGMLSYTDARGEHAKLIESQGMKRRAVRVPLTSMDDLLKDHAGPIDAAVIDVEGGEVTVLGGFDLARFKPRVLLLEDNSGGKDQALASYMEKQPYVFVGWVEVNRIYVHRDEAQVIARAEGRAD